MELSRNPPSSPFAVVRLNRPLGSLARTRRQHEIPNTDVPYRDDPVHLAGFPVGRSHNAMCTPMLSDISLCVVATRPFWVGGFI